MEQTQQVIAAHPNMPGDPGQGKRLIKTSPHEFDGLPHTIIQRKES
jgi:hypothetical protein